MRLEGEFLCYFKVVATQVVSTFGAKIGHLSFIEVKSGRNGGQKLSFYLLTLQTWHLACKVLLCAN